MWCVPHDLFVSVATRKAETMTTTKEGNTWYTDDAEYAVEGDRIRRGDGSYTEIDSDQDADTIAEELAAGKRSDSEFGWIDD
jgi:hypothetical protein